MLQDVAGENAWTKWGVVVDDLVLLGTDNRVAELYNLHDLDLTVEANRDVLKARLRELATP